jgi:hypothetical protein
MRQRGPGSSCQLGAPGGYAVGSKAAVMPDSRLRVPRVLVEVQQRGGAQRAVRQLEPQRLAAVTRALVGISTEYLGRGPRSASTERLTGPKVLAFISGNHVDPDVVAELFVLDGRREAPLGHSEVSRGRLAGI